MEINDYLVATVDPYALTIFGGYIARKVRSMRPIALSAVKLYANLKTVNM